jgi:transposase
VTGCEKETKNMLMGAKVFTATKAKDREELGEVLTRWLRDNPKNKVIDKVVTQSSDNEFHCLSITIFYEVPSPATT